MNRFLLSIAILSATLRLAQAQEVTKIVKYSPSLNVGYEKVLQEKRSVYVGASLFSAAGLSAVGVKGEYRFYLSNSKQAPKGFFVAPTALLWYVNSRVLDDAFNSLGAGEKSVSGAYVQVGGIAGHQWIIKNKFSIEPCFGLSVGTNLGGEPLGGIFSGMVLPLVALRVGYVLK